MLVVGLGSGGCAAEADRERNPSPAEVAEHLAAVPDHDQVQVTVDGQPQTWEVVNTPASARQGLSGRQELGADGMLFVGGLTGDRPIWMKDMRFDLDLVWLAGELVVDIEAHVPAPTPGTADSELPTYTNDVPANLVLELPAGDAARLGLKPGNRIAITAPAPSP